jgi:soluble lytic murein transglycosylase-like protein
MIKLKQAILPVMCLFFFLQAPATADIYRYVDENGDIYFADYPKGSHYDLYIETRKEKSFGKSRKARNEWIIRYVEEMAQLKGVEPALVKAIIKVESNYDHQAVSQKGAKGIMQILPRSFPEEDENNLFDPLRNVEIGVNHLKNLLDKFSGNIALALAAYNAGEGAVMKYNGIPPYPETRAYVEKVLAFYKKYRE